MEGTLGFYSQPTGIERGGERVLDLNELRKTPLFECHQKHGGKIVDFGGWALPVQYTGIIDEHRAVRNEAGLFDVSHMGEIRVEGPGALDFVNYLLTNDISTLSINQVQYSPMCYPDGGVVDDLLTYKIADDEYLLVVNASNKDKDYEWIATHADNFDVTITDESDETAQLAIQGPRALDILGAIIDIDLPAMKYFWFEPAATVAGHEALVSRTGYTGENGFEIYCSLEAAPEIWDALMDAGEGQLSPAGLGARDTLRFEAGMCLYGQELGPDINPLEARLKYFVRLGKDDFIGKDALEKAHNEGVQRKLVGFEMIDRGIPRTSYPIFDEEGREVGHVTSGSFSPTLEKNIGLGYVETDLAKVGVNLKIGVRKRMLSAVTVKIPFYKREG